MHRKRTSLIATGIALAMPATACGADTTAGNGGDNSGTERTPGEETVTVNGGEVVLTSGLAQFGDCTALLTHLRTEGADRVGAYGFNTGDYWWGGEFDDIAIDDAAEMVEEASADMVTDASGDDAGFETASAELESSDGGGLVEGEDFSGTNNQEQGVDEPDYVKTDGTRILTVTNGRFTYVDIDGSNPIKRGSIALGHSTQQMLIVDDTAYLFGTSWGEEEYYYEDDIAVSDGDAEADFASDAIEPVGGFMGPSAEVIELDISNPDSPTVIARLKIDGMYLSARKIGTNITVATQSDQYDMGFVYPQGPSGEETAANFNKQIVMETEIGDWLPNYRLDRSGDITTGQLTECGDVHAPADFAGFGSLSVMTFDGSVGLDAPAASSVLASGQNVYASTNTMWISTNRWIDWSVLDDDARQEAEDSYTSEIHGFSLGDGAPDYLASGAVRGTLLNQFAMSEHDDVLRVATTDGSIWGRNQDSESFVTTFEVDGSELRQIGQVGDMGRGEQIFAVRFVGDVGYVVTFRQTDPFYTVDLSDPTSPEVLGELKITGYSGQLHPLGPDHVLGIGQEATEEGIQTGAKVTLFDVSDLSNPTDVANWTVDNSWTEAEWDHKAFLWWPQENLAVIPIQNWSEGFFGAIAFRVDLEEGTVTEAGRLTHEPEDGDQQGNTECDVLPADAFDVFRGGDTMLAEMAEEMAWLSMDGGQMQDCASGQTGASGLYCEPWDWLELTDEQRDVIGLDGTLEFCWPEGPGQDPIIRTLVVGDTLWSLSWSRLQANDLGGSFAAGEFVEIS